jgi:hypothetical protein
MYRPLIASICVITFIGTSSAQKDKEKPEPAKPTAHTEKDIEGWKVHVDDRLLADENKEIYAHVSRILANRLYDMKQFVPKDKVTRLQKVPIWLDLSHGKLKPAQYHPSAGWLKGNGYDETMVKCVHIPVAAEFASARHQSVQPWSILHELAHAYHDQVLKFDNAEVKAVYEKFKAKEKYKNILHIDGRTTSHYGLTTPMEFFAEFTESYFAVNDFFPFNRAELKTEEPEIYELMSKIWGPVAAREKK